MFKGKNTLLLNEDTIILAVQEYLNRRVHDSNSESLKVVSVNSRNDSSVQTFEIVTEEKEIA